MAPRTEARNREDGSDVGRADSLSVLGTGRGGVVTNGRPEVVEHEGDINHVRREQLTDQTRTRRVHRPDQSVMDRPHTTQASRRVSVRAGGS